MWHVREFSLTRALHQVRVHHIVAGSPAAKAKLTSHTRGDAGPAIGTGDVLLEINGQPCLDASYDDVVTTLHEQR